MQFTLGMPFLAVLGKFYRNLKGLKNHARDDCVSNNTAILVLGRSF